MNAVYSVDQPNTPAWRERVASYLEKATRIANRIDLILDETRMGAASSRSGEIDPATQQLLAAVSDLERVVEMRDELLCAVDAPPAGLSLSEKLLSTRRIEDARMAKCCGEAADLIAQTHQRALSLFICQYHLSAVPRDWIARLTAGTSPRTSMGSSQQNASGGRFNEAA